MFPTVSGSNLAGQSFTIPHDFAGEQNIVVLAFQRKQQFDVDTWQSLITTLLQTHPHLRAYELPVLSRGGPLFRRWLDGVMRAGIPDPAIRSTTITLYLHKAKFLRQLQIPDDQHIVVMVVDRAGNVTWRGYGPCGPAAAQALTQALA